MGTHNDKKAIPQTFCNLKQPDTYTHVHVKNTNKFHIYAIYTEKIRA